MIIFRVSEQNGPIHPHLPLPFESNENVWFYLNFETLWKENNNCKRNLLCRFDDFNWIELFDSAWPVVENQVINTYKHTLMAWTQNITAVVWLAIEIL